MVTAKGIKVALRQREEIVRRSGLSLRDLLFECRLRSGADLITAARGDQNRPYRGRQFSNNIWNYWGGAQEYFPRANGRRGMPTPSQVLNDVLVQRWDFRQL